LTGKGHDTGAGRRFLFLQGPHGPFFWTLARMLRCAGADVARVGFNAGDAAFWPDRASYIPYLGPAARWPESLAAICAERGITDIVLYGDTRPVHAAAAAHAAAQAIRLHVFEEGYLRPYWVTYERGGANGHSALMRMSVAEMRADLAGIDPDLPEAPARWGDLRQHVFYGALYHFHVLCRNRAYPLFRPHRSLTVAEEFRVYLRRLVTMPVQALRRHIATRRVRTGGFAYHLALLQLPHDASVLAHSPFAGMEAFLRLCIAEFAAGAPAHHRLVVKAHPLDDGRRPLRRVTRDLARRHGIGERVHFVQGGKLAWLLDHAQSVVTVNSTAAQQALWRGIPVRAFGQAVYAKPEFVSAQPLAAFFADPAPPDSRAYRSFRQYLQETSQVPGSYYSAAGRRRLVRRVTDMLLAPEDPYGALRTRSRQGMAGASMPHPFRVVGGRER